MASDLFCFFSLFLNLNDLIILSFVSCIFWVNLINYPFNVQICSEEILWFYLGIAENYPSSWCTV